MDDLSDRLGEYLADYDDRGPYVTLGEARAVLELLTLVGHGQPSAVQWAAAELRARIGLRLPSL